MAAFVLLLAVACRPDVGSDPSTYVPRVLAVFDPTQGAVPLPNDLLMGDGELALPTELPAFKGPDGLALKAFTPAMEELVTSYLNRMDAWPRELPLTVAFSQYTDPDDPAADVAVDPATLATAIKAYDVTDPAAWVEVTGLKIGTPMQLTGPTGLVTWQVAVAPPAPWTPGHRYVALVLTRALDAKGEAVASSAAFNYLKARSPAEDTEEYKKCPSKSVLVVDPLCNDDPADLATYEDDYAAIPADPIQSNSDESAKQLELIRRSMEPLFDALDDPARGEARFPRGQIAILWTFSVTPSPEVVFDPANSLIPTPNDLLVNPATGRLAFPLPEGVKCDDTATWDALGDAAIQAAFFCYMNGLDGFSTTSAAAAGFSTALSPTTVVGATPETAAGATVRIMDLSGAAPAELTSDDVAVAWVAGQVQVVPRKPFVPGHRYLVALTRSLADADGRGANPSPAMAMLLLKNALADVAAGKTSLPGTLTDAEAMQFEAIRASYAPMLDLLDAGETPVLPRSSIAAFFTFTVASDNEALFDPTAGVIPFPNEVLMDQKTGRVALPISPSDPEGVKAIIGGLNMLDGFSTVGPESTGFALALDATTLKLTAPLELPADPGIPDFVAELGKKLNASSVGVADITEVDAANPLTLTKLATYDGFDIDAEAAAAGKLVLTPKAGMPLPPKRRYMVVVFDSVKSAKAGEAVPGIHVSPTFFLARTEYALVNAEGKSNLPQLLTDALAGQLEQLRLGYKPIFDAMGLVGIPRTRVLLFFTFWTGSTYQELDAVAKGTDLVAPLVWGPEMELLPTTHENVKALFGANPLGDVGLVCLDCALKAKILLASPDLTDPQNPKLGHFAYQADGKPKWQDGLKLPFLLILPKGAPPAGGWPVVLFQHGLDNAKDQVASIANDLAAAGFAVVAIDAPHHGGHPIRIPGTPDGTGFFSADVFAVADNLREIAIDQRQVVLFLKQRANAWLETKGQPAGALDVTHLGYLGVSLGGISGAVSAAVDPDLERVALVVAGGHLMRIFNETQNVDFQMPLVKALAALGIAPGSAAFDQFVMMAQWAVDRADPVNYGAIGKGAAPKDRYLLVSAKGDEFIPNTTTDELRIAYGLSDADGSFKVFPTGATATDAICHGFFLEGCDGTKFPKAAAARTDARAAVLDFLAGK
jgi:dienelactone hydrolase